MKPFTSLIADVQKPACVDGLCCGRAATPHHRAGLAPAVAGGGVQALSHLPRRRARLLAGPLTLPEGPSGAVPEA